MLASSPSSSSQQQQSLLASPTSTATAASATNNNNNINPKLLHLVQKIVTQAATATTATLQSKNNATTSKPPPPPTVEYVVHCVRTQNVEYQRKNLERLKKQVKEALTFVLAKQKKNKNATISSSPLVVVESRKRVRHKPKSKQATITANTEDPTMSSDDDDDEKDDCLHDVQREQMVDSSALNASLRLRYEKLQRERDAEAAAAREAAKAAAVATAASTTSTENNNTNADIAETTETLNPESTPNSNTTTTNNNANNNSNKSRKRKLADRRRSLKASLSSSSSKRAAAFPPSNNNNNNSYYDNDDHDNDKAALLRPVARPTERYSDLGGMERIIQQIRELIEYPLMRPEIYAHLGVGPPRGILLRGPPGCGKTHLANAIAGQLNTPYFRVSAPELVSGMSGESEGRIRELFRAAADHAPAIIFMDELDAIAPKRSDAGSSRGMEKRMVAQLLTSMDLLDPKYTRNQAPVIVLGATNRPDALDPALRRAGRFDKEILLGVPDEAARQNIILTMTKGMRLSGDFDFKVLARKTPGFVGADVRSLTKEAAVIAINRIFRDVLLENTECLHNYNKKIVINDNDNDNNNNDNNKERNISPEDCNDQKLGSIPQTTQTNKSTTDNMTDGDSSVPAALYTTTANETTRPLKPLTPEQLEPLYVTMEDFLNAVPLVQPSGKREGFAVVPDVTWDDIGAMHEIREELTMSVLEPIRSPEKFKLLGLSLPAGVLLYGPPGCGKTLLAKAVANESGANFISVKGPELLDKYVGESEKAVRLVFERARSSSPCIVFFDELDSLCPKRGSDGGGSGVSERVVNQLLTEMDGLESRRSVFVIAATNRPELIDPAMMRPGRLDKLLYVPLPSAADRAAILSALSPGVKFGKDVDLDAIGRSHRADGYSGADCAALMREAGLAVLKEDIADTAAGKGPRSDSDLCIEARHFESAFHHVMPSVSKKDQARYDRIRHRMARARTRGTVSDVVEGTEGLNTTLNEAEEGGDTEKV